MTAQSAKYNWTPVNVGYPSAYYTWTPGNVIFTFTGAAPYCAIAPSNPITPKSVSPYQPAGSVAPAFWAIPKFDFLPAINPLTAANMGGPPSLGGLAHTINLIIRQLMSLGKAVQAIAGTIGGMQNDSTNTNTPHNNQTSPNNNNNNATGTFRENKSARVTSKHRIFNPNDNTQYVDITQIDGLQWTNGTGAYIIWSR